MIATNPISSSPISSMTAVVDGGLELFEFNLYIITTKTISLKVVNE